YAYHNHWWELADLGGTPALYRLRDLLAPSIAFEVDVYWVKLAGHDPAALLRDLGERAPLLHLKDGPLDQPESPMLAAGTGAMDFPPVLAAAHAAWGFVELDFCATDMLTAVTASAQYFLSSNLTQGQS
nr:sugar phosphate isomerase/epimerase [Anaerolineae bacterium]